MAEWSKAREWLNKRWNDLVSKHNGDIDKAYNEYVKDAFFV